MLNKSIDIHCPVHLIHGAADVEVPWTFSNRLAQRIKSPEVTLTLVKNGDQRLNAPFALSRLYSLLNEINQSISH